MKAPHNLYGKKLLPLTILLLLTLSLLRAFNVNITRVSALDSPWIKVMPESIVDPTLTPGETFTVSIYTNYDYWDVTSYELTLYYNPKVLHGGINNTDTWTGDDVTTIFNTTQTPVVQDSEKVYVNQNLMTKPANYSIDYEKGEITFTFKTTDTWTGDGMTTVFNTTQTPVVQDSEKVYVNQNLIRKGDYSIDYDKGEITFTTAPSLGAEIEVTYNVPPGLGAEIKAIYLYGGVTNGDLIVGGSATFWAGPFDNTAGKLFSTLAYYDAEGAVTTGPGTLANVTFTVVDIGSSYITIGNETILYGWDFFGWKPYAIIDAAKNTTHIQHGFFNNKLTGSIAGKVTDNSTGLPISDATITAVGPQTNSTSTAGDGTYSLDEVLVGEYTVTASAPGYFPNTTEAIVTENATTTLNLTLTLILVPGWIDGKVTDAKTGSAIVGANVIANGFIGFTDETGYYNIAVLAPETYNVTASMQGYYDHVETDVFVSKEATTTVNFTLQPIVGWIVGMVKDVSTGGSIEGANMTTTLGGYSATTDASGYYWIADVQVGTYNVITSADGYYSDSKPATVTENATTTVNFDLDPLPGAINGTVVDAATALPIAGAIVTTTPGGYSATTDASGTYTISEVPVGTYSLVEASAKGYFYTRESKIVVTSGNTTTVNFELTHMEHDVAVTAISIPTEATQGESVTISVSLRNRGDYDENFTIKVIIKETGTTILEKMMTLAVDGYTIEKVDFDTSTAEPDTYTIKAEAILVKDDDPDSNEKEKTITIKPKTGSLAGKVTDASTGLPISDATITAVGPENRSTSTTGNGTYSLDEVLVGDYTVTASAPGYISDSKPVTVHENVPATVDLALTLLPGTVSGVVKDSSTGDPIAGATVTVDGMSATTNSSGGYMVSDVPVGTYNVTVSADGYQSSSQTDITVTAGETTIADFELTPVQPLNLLLYAGVAAVATVFIAGTAVYIFKIRKPT